MSAPVALQNAVTDALGVEHPVGLPLTPARVWERIRVKPAPFRYRRPETLEQALALLGEHGAERAGARGRPEPRAR